MNPLVKPEDIENEERAIKQLCCGQAHQNIVIVLRLGELSASSYYFIDMELCEFSLDDYIHNPLCEPGVIFKDSAASLKQLQIFNIMLHSCSGVQYIHDKGQVHRDIKPSNATLPSLTR